MYLIYINDSALHVLVRATGRVVEQRTRNKKKKKRGSGPVFLSIPLFQRLGSRLRVDPVNQGVKPPKTCHVKQHKLLSINLLCITSLHQGHTYIQQLSYVYICFEPGTVVVFNFRRYFLFSYVFVCFVCLFACSLTRYVFWLGCLIGLAVIVG